MRLKRIVPFFFFVFFILAFIVHAQNSGPEGDEINADCVFGDTDQQPCGICGTRMRECDCDQPVEAQEGACYGWKSWGNCQDPCKDNCGNEKIDPPEECDDGNGDEKDGCTSSCRFSRCDDSDYGKSFEKKGKIKGRNLNGAFVEREDRCINAQQLEEWFCVESIRIASQIKTCEHGCDSGECEADSGSSNPEKDGNSNDSPTPENENTLGEETTTSPGTTPHTSKNSENQPDESLDSSTDVLPEPLRKTRKPSLCRDEDGGNNPFKPARTMGKNVDGNNVEGRDQCVDKRRLIEYSCRGDVLYRETIRCGEGCEEGACLTKSKILTPTIDEVPLNNDFLSKEERKKMEEQKKKEEELLKRFKKRAERERQRQAEVEKEREGRIQIGAVLEKVEKDFLVQKIRTKVMEELTEEPPLVREADKAEIETVIRKPEFVLDTRLTERDAEIALDRITTTRIKKAKAEQVFDRIRNENITTDLVNEELAKVEAEIAQDLETLEQEVEEFRRKYERTIDNVEIKKSIAFQTVDDRLTGEVQDETVITLNIKPKNILTNFSVYQEIPKEIARDVGELIFYDTNYEVLENDPLIVWNFANVNDDVTVSYGVRKKLETAAVNNIATIPVTGKVTEQEVERVGSLLKIYFPLGMIALIVIVVVMFRRHSLKH